jgi:hypothetical protein
LAWPVFAWHPKMQLPCSTAAADGWPSAHDRSKTSIQNKQNKTPPPPPKKIFGWVCLWMKKDKVAQWIDWGFV